MEKLIQLYTTWKGAPPADVKKLAGAGSNRVYYRFTGQDGETVIGAVGTSNEENNAFIYLAKHFCERALPVPTVLAVGDQGIRYLQTDLGNVSLYEAIAQGRKAGGNYSEHEVALLKRTIRLLPYIQLSGNEDLDYSHCYPTPAFDETSVFFDLNYFKYCFLKETGVEFNELKLEADFHALCSQLLNEALTGFMYRDFQARNVMLDADEQPWLIDFQGGRKGPIYYDVASFLWQASALYSEELREQLIAEYVAELQQFVDVNVSRFKHRLRLFVLFRLLQVLGAYGFRGYFERKQYFIDSIKPAVRNLAVLLAEGQLALPPYLRQVLEQMVAKLTQEDAAPSKAAESTKVTSPQTNEHGKASVSKYDGQGPLVVRVFSFSYKKGIPEDESGNGGGYVFDCRSTHNPGRYEPYKQKTGLDADVIQFLEDDGEILTFLKSVYELADAHVERYMKRGFTNLMFSFGCTGGQHRSVYSAQHLAEHLHNKYGIEVRIVHREQHISSVLK